MKAHFKTLAAAAGFAVIGSTAMAADWEDVEIYDFEEATLVYNVTGMQSGTQEMLIKDHGRRTAQFNQTTLNMMGVSQETNTGSWTEADWVYTYDYNTQTGSKIANPLKNMFQNNEDPKDAMLAFLTGMGGKEVGSDTFNGTSCTVYELAMAGTKMCISDDMIMQYTRMNMMGMSMSVELQSINIGSVDDSRFEKPDATYNEVTVPAGMGMPGSN